MGKMEKNGKKITLPKIKRRKYGMNETIVATIKSKKKRDVPFSHGCSDLFFSLEKHRTVLDFPFSHNNLKFCNLSCNNSRYSAKD
jgi:hypothetical protein